jgi:hypothetical protein
MHSLNTIPNKKFGLFIAGVMFILAIYQGTLHFHAYSWVLLLVFSLLAIAVALYLPSVFNWPNHIWHLLGRYMGLVISPMVLGVIYFLLITPISLVTRFFGRDELALKRPKVMSYWIVKDKSNDSSYKNQF